MTKEVNGVKSNPASLKLEKAGGCDPKGLQDSRPESSDRNQSAR
jgi:hypothetical protein